MKNWDTGSTPSSFYKEFAAHFADGDVPSGKIVEWRKGDGTTVISSQADDYIAWPSGALRTASFTIQYPSALAASASDTLKAYAKTGSWNNTSWATTSAITNRDIRLEIVISGTTYTLSANNEVTRGTNITQIRSGPISAAWRIWGEMRNGTGINSTPQGNLWGKLILTFFADGTYSAWGEIQPNRLTTSSFSASDVSVTSYALKDYVGPTTLFSYSTAFTLYAAAPIACVNADGLHPYTGTSVDKCVVGFPILTLSDSTTTGLYDACITNWYVSTSTMIANIDPAGSSSNYVPCSAIDYGNVDQSGGSAWIGQMALFAVQAMLTGDWVHLRADRINAFSQWSMQSSFMDAVTSYPINLSHTNSYSGLPAATPSTGWGPGGNITLPGTAPPSTGGYPKSRGFSHAPLYAWYQLIATGQRQWLDMVHEVSISDVGGQNADTTGNQYRNPTVNGTTYYGVPAYGQARSLAWNIRNYCNQEWLTPDTHPMKPYVGYLISNIYAMLADWVAPTNSPVATQTLGVYNGGEANFQTTGLNAGWEHDFICLQFATSMRRGRITNTQAFVTHHLIKWVLGRQTDGCAYGSYSYQIGVSAGYPPQFPTITSYPTSWTQVWVNDPGYFLALPNGSACPSSGIDPTNPFAIGHNYPSIAMAACAVAEAGGMSSKATTAYNYLAIEETAAALTEADWADGCQWRIRRPA